MEFTYLVGEGAEAKAVIDSAMGKVNEYLEAVNLELANYPKDTEACDKGSGIYGLLRKIETPFTEEEYKQIGLRPTEVLTIDGVKYQSYAPNLRSKKGKELNARFKTINKLKVSFSKAVIASIGAERMVVGEQTYGFGNALYFSTAGAKDDKLFIKIPGKPVDTHTQGGDSFPALPGWLREPQGDEYKVFLK